MQKTYRTPENKRYFVDNEFIYTENMKEVFEHYEDNIDSASYFAGIFSKFDEMFNKNSKTYSQLKHLSYKLSNILSSAGKLIHEISDLYSTSIIDEEQTFKKINFKTITDVDSINKKLKIGLTEWGSQMITQSRYVIDNIAGYFHYKKHENIEFAKLIKMKININNNFMKASNELDAKKKKLFDGKNMEKWKVNHSAVPGDFGEHSRSFDSIKPFMLPDVC